MLRPSRPPSIGGRWFRAHRPPPFAPDPDQALPFTVEFGNETHPPIEELSKSAAGVGVALGYHGTSVKAAAEIIAHGFIASSNEYDWLGDGTYFFQDAPQRAFEWASTIHEEPRVLCARLSLDGCMDLLDIGWFSFLNDTFDRYISRSRRLGLALPKQSSGAHRLDRAVINYAADLLAVAGTPIRSVRGAFAEGRSAFPESALLDRSHVQIAVRDPTVILEVGEALLDPETTLRRRVADDYS